MKKILLVMSAVAIMLFGNDVTAEAAPKVMADGNTFDAEFYAQTYPDVVAVLGTDETMLYQHYQTYGAMEGRSPYAPGTGPVVAVPQGNTVDVLGAETFNQFPKVYGQDYQEQLWSKSSDFIQRVDSVWSGTADELIQLCLEDRLKYEEYKVTYPENGYDGTYSKFYNYTVTGKVTGALERGGYGNQVKYLTLFLETSHQKTFLLHVEPDTPYTIGETITIKGYTDLFKAKYFGFELTCGARTIPQYEW